VALFQYHKLVTRLLHEEREEVANVRDITDFINIARGQLAGEAECIRVEGTVETVTAQRSYLFSSINLGASPTISGVAGVMNVRRLSYAIASGRKWIFARPWEWFDLYYLSQPISQPSAPLRWSQYGQGSSSTGVPATGFSSTPGGSFYIDPVPDQSYTLFCDCVCYPQPLALDADVEAIPYIFSDAVPFLAAWYALVSMQRPSDDMMSRYQMFLGRARQFSNPSPERRIYQQSADPSQLAKIGMTARAQ
jgi:hypothetical protein